MSAPALFRRTLRVALALFSFALLATARAHTTPTTPEPVGPGEFAPGFRLTDHLGVTHDLFYESTAKAIVLVFTEAGSSRAVQTASALQAMRSRFSAADVMIWQIDSNLGASRVAIAAEQAQLNNSTPVLIDEIQLVASAFGVTRQLETLVIKPFGWTLVYRGPLDNADPATLAAPTQNFASDAAAAVVAGSAVANPLVAMPATAPFLDLPAATVPDYAGEVAPIVLRSCVQCHSAGNIAPFVFEKYDDLHQRAVQIRATLLQKRMTPWHADSQHGVFSNNTAITPAEIATLFKWVSAGAPQGGSADPLATAPTLPDAAWPLGPPDLIVNIAAQNLPATGVLAYRYLTVAVPLSTDKWLRAAVVRPGNLAVVHHALVFEGTLLDVIGNAGGLGGFFAGYVPGLNQTWFPDGSGKLLRRNSSVTFQMHYTTTGKAETDQTQLGFYFAASAPERELLTKSAFTTAISIPAGAKEYAREATFLPSATKDTMLYELNPHMHYRGKRFKYEALYPNGTSEVLLNVPQYDFHWQSQYRLAQPKRLPAGTVIRARGAFDNSAQNVANPNPAATVGFGEQTTDEMFVGYINYAELPGPPAAPAPVFGANLVAHAHAGDAFVLPVAAVNAVASYRAESLPPGLVLNATSGVISGTPQNAGRRAIRVFAENAAGSAVATVDLSVTAEPGSPSITNQPATVAASVGGSASFSVVAEGTAPLAYQWFFNDHPLAGATAATLMLPSVGVANAGEYSVRVSNTLGSIDSKTAILGIISTTKVVGAGSEVGTNIVHANGNVYDQVLLQGAAAAVTADPGQVVRISYVDYNDDIVQVEFAGAGTLALVLDGATGPAAPLKYNQSVAYMKGHASVVIAGANETTNVSIFSVGRANAVNQALFRDDVTYDGLADIAFVAIASANGKFGGVRTANASYFSTKGPTGIHAPNVQFTGPVFIGDINAFDAGTPLLALGSAADARVTGGDFSQANASAVQVSGIAKLRFTNGSTSHGVALPAQTNKSRLEQNGVDVTAVTVANPGQ